MANTFSIKKNASIEIDYEDVYGISVKDLFGFTTDGAAHLFAQDSKFLISFWDIDVAPLVQEYKSITLIDVIRELNLCEPSDIKDVLTTEKDFSVAITINI